MGLRQVAIAADRLLNACTGGYADEMLSARAWRLRNSGRVWCAVRVTIDWVALHIFRDPDHCREAYISETRRKYAPSEYRS